MTVRRNGNLCRVYSNDSGLLQECTSYSTMLFCWSEDRSYVINNTTRYSPTTQKQRSRYLNSDLRLLDARHIRVVEIDGMNRGVTQYELRRVAALKVNTLDIEASACSCGRCIVCASNSLGA